MILAVWVGLLLVIQNIVKGHEHAIRLRLLATISSILCDTMVGFNL